MANYAVVKDNVVLNLVEWDGVTEYSVPEDGGTASGGDINATGGWSSTSDQQTSHTAMSGGGGVQAGSFGGPGGCLYDGAGKAGNGYGMGASGGYVNQAGGAGSGGLVWVQEYK